MLIIKVINKKCKDNGMKNGVATLMHLPKGQTSEMEPLQPNKNAPRHWRVHSNWLHMDNLNRSFPCSLNRTIPNKISEVFSVSAK